MLRLWQRTGAFLLLWPLALVAGALSCSRELGLPSASDVRVDAFEPVEGYAGATILVRGQFLGQDPNGIEVRVGTSRALAPIDATGALLRFVVPDDASSGRITVVNALGRAQSSANFTFQGVGHLRLNAVTASVDLRPDLLSAFPIDASRTLALEGRYLWAGLLDAQGHTARLGGNPAVAVQAIGTTQVVLDLDGTGCPAGSLGHLSIFAGTVLVGAPCLSGPAPTDLGPATVRLALDDAATHAVVVTRSALFLVDLALLTVRKSDLALGELPVVAPLSGSKFIWADSHGLRRIDWTNGSNPPLDAVVGTGTPGGLAAIAVAPATHALALAGSSALVQVLDTSVWPPVPTQTVTLVAAGVTGLAFSTDGHRLAVTRASAPGFSLHDLTLPHAPPLTSVPTTGTGGQPIASDDGRLFFVGDRGRVLLVSQQTGLAVGETKLTSGMRPAALRTLPGTDTTPEHAVVEVPLQAFNAIVRLDARTLGNVEWKLRLSEPPVIGAAALPGGQDLFVLHTTASGDELRKLEHQGELDVEAASDRGLIKNEGAAPTVLSVSPGDDAVLLELGTNFLVPAGYGVALFRPRATWSTAANPVVYPLGVAFSGPTAGKAHQALADGSDHLILIGPGGIRALALSTALDGTEQEQWNTDLTGEFLFAATAPGRVFVVNRCRATATGCTASTIPSLQIALLDNGAYIDNLMPTWDANENRGLVVPAGGRRLYSLRGQGDSVRLVSTLVDPETAVSGPDELPVPLPAGAERLLAYPDGEHLLVEDPQSDRVLLIE